MVFVCFCYPLKTNKGSTITRKTFDFHLLIFRAANEARTRDPQLGKLMLYQLSYYRISRFPFSECKGINSLEIYNTPWFTLRGVFSPWGFLRCILG